MITMLVMFACTPEPKLEPEPTTTETGPVDPTPADTAPPEDTGSDWSWCGDGAVAEGEDCDDGNGFGGDGCSSTCTAESGTPESEPNDTVAEATPLTELGGLLNASLPRWDVDCWSLSAATCGAIRAEQQAPCGSPLALTLYAPDGSTLAAGGVDADGCASIMPEEAPGARWVAGGAYVVCASALAGATVPDYALTLTTQASEAGWPVSEVDLDGDGVPPSCDDDRDGDGVLDDEDTCPDLSNGPDSAALTVNGSGYVTDWLTAGPFAVAASTDTCRPHDEATVGEDGPLAPTLGDAAGSATWVAALGAGEVLDFTLDYGGIPAPREAYAYVYLTSPTARRLTLSVGADDGMFAWWNGARVLDVVSCQGVNRDQFQVDVDVVEGLNTLLVKVHDQGGGWGVAARLLDGGAPVVDLVPNLDADPSWRPDQVDSDGDGVGDICE